MNGEGFDATNGRRFGNIIGAGTRRELGALFGDLPAVNSVRGHQHIRASDR